MIAIDIQACVIHIGDLKPTVEVLIFVDCMNVVIYMLIAGPYICFNSK